MDPKKVKDATDKINKAFADLQREIDLLNKLVSVSVNDPNPPNLDPNVSTPVSSTGTTSVSSTLKGGSKTYACSPTSDWQAVFDVKSNATLSECRVQSPKGNQHGVLMSGNKSTAEDVQFLNDGGNCFMIRGDDVVIRRAACGTFEGYAIYNDGKKNLLVEDLSCIGGSSLESIIRFGGQGSGTLRRVKVIYNTTSRKSCLRGSGDYKIFDSYFDGAGCGIAPLGKGDGGRGWLLDRVLTDRIITVANALETRVAVFAAVKAGTTNAMQLARVFRDNAKDKQGKPIPMSDAQLQASIERRAAEIGLTASAEFTNTTIKDGYALEAGSVATFTNCTIESPTVIFYSFIPNYPDPPRNGDPGWLLPYDKPRALPKVVFHNCTLNAPDVPLGLFANVPMSEWNKYVKGSFTLNGRSYNL